MARTLFGAAWRPSVPTSASLRRRARAKGVVGITAASGSEPIVGWRGVLAVRFIMVVVSVSSHG